MARSIKMAAFIGLILLFVIESVTGVVESKIIGRNSGGSFYTRWNDTFSGFEIGLESPIAGQGVFSERKAEILLEHRVQNISNGFAAFVMDTGLILPAVWLWLMYLGIRTKFAKERLLYVLGVFLLYFLCINTEGVFLNILFWGCWASGSRTRRKRLICRQMRAGKGNAGGAALCRRKNCA